MPFNGIGDFFVPINPLSIFLCTHQFLYQLFFVPINPLSIIFCICLSLTPCRGGVRVSGGDLCIRKYAEALTEPAGETFRARPKADSEPGLPPRYVKSAHQPVGAIHESPAKFAQTKNGASKVSPAGSVGASKLRLEVSTGHPHLGAPSEVGFLYKPNGEASPVGADAVIRPNTVGFLHEPNDDAQTS